MKRLVFPIVTLAILAMLPGCGSDPLPAADGSDLPSEVQEYEKRRQSEREKKVTPRAPSPSHGSR